MFFRLVFGTAAALAIAGCAATAPAPVFTSADLRASETAFAKTMADRDFDAFASFVGEDAVFVNGGTPLRGKAAVLEHWKRFFTPGKPAPFSWTPETAELTGSGDLGYTEGPVSAPDGKLIGRFHTTWKRAADGQWRVAFDNGASACDCKK